MNPLLTVKDLDVAYGTDRGRVTAVQGVGFEMEPGERVTIVGESGSGKSSVARAVLGLLDPARTRIAGSVNFAGSELLGLSDKQFAAVRGADVTFVMQDHAAALNPTSRIGRQLREVLELHRDRVPAHERDGAVDRVLREVGLNDVDRVRRSFPFELSGGMRQRVLIAMAIIGGPRLLIADEPTTALDAVVQKQILDLLRSIATARGMAILSITHSIDVARYLSDRIVVMKDGVIVEQGTASQVLNEPQHPYTRQLLAAASGAPLTGDRTPGPVVLRADAVSKRFRSRARVGGMFSRRAEFLALDDVSFELGEGETVAVVGESGSGKSTLVRCLAGLERLDAGSIAFGPREGVGRPASSISELGYVFQDPYGSMNPRWSVRDVLTEPLTNARVPRSRRATLIEESLTRVHLDPVVVERRIAEFSGGQRQRIAIARALITHPRVLLLDEPTAALDASIQRRVVDLLIEIQTQTGAGFLFITHDLTLAGEVADRVVVLQRGRIVEEGPAAEILAHPVDDYTRMLVSAHALRAPASTSRVITPEGASA